MPAQLKLTPENKIEIFMYFQACIQIKELAHAFGVGSWTIQNIITEKLKENFDNIHIRDGENFLIEYPKI